jgi:hypothetical protein
MAPPAKKSAKANVDTSKHDILSFFGSAQSHPATSTAKSEGKPKEALTPKETKTKTKTKAKAKTKVESEDSDGGEALTPKVTKTKTKAKAKTKVESEGSDGEAKPKFKCATF